MAATARRRSTCPICRAACRSIRARPERHDLSDRRAGRRRERDADDAADPDPQPRAARVRRHRPTQIRRPTLIAGASTGARSTSDAPPTAAMDAGVDQPGRRQPAARQHAALSRDQLHHLAVRHLPVARLRSARHVRSIRRRDPHVRLQFRAHRLGALQRPAAADLAEHRSVLAARHDLWRRRQVDLRAARTSRASRRCTRARARA